MAVFFSRLTLALTRLQENSAPANIPPPNPPSGDYSRFDYDSRDYFAG